MRSDEADRRFMRLAISLGQRGLGQVWPNPAVGCVIVKEGVIVGRGWTQPGGRPHAERCALDQAGARAQGAVAYVSLEPCAHHGQTPPCAHGLIEAGIVRVVSAMTDPDPRVSGQGHAMLRSAGVEVIEGVEAPAARAAHAGFLRRIEQGRPWVTLKLAFTLDARIATSTGVSRWITGPQARRHVHLLRATHDAVLVGAGTALADDPDLRIRDLGVAHQPVRIVADSRLRHSARSRLGTSARECPVWMLHGALAPEAQKHAWSEAGAELFFCPSDEAGRIEIGQALQKLATRGLTRVLCEGGGSLAASLLSLGLVDELQVFSAGHVFGADGVAGVGAMGVSEIDPRIWELRKQHQIGGDLLHVWHRRDAALR